MAKKTVKARALVDIHGTPVKAGEFFIADETVVAGLVKGGQADSNATEHSVYGANVPEAIDLTAAAVADAAQTAAAAASAAAGETAGDAGAQA
jgi:hypothetical protein